MAAAAAPPGSLAVAAEAGEANRAFEDVAVTLEDIQRFTVRNRGLTSAHTALLSGRGRLIGMKAAAQLAADRSPPFPAGQRPPASRLPARPKPFLPSCVRARRWQKA